MSTELEQAAKMYTHGMSTRRIRTAEDISQTVQKGFKDGAQWQAKQDEAMINNFFSRDALIEINYQFFHYCNTTLVVNPLSFFEWFTLNYPPKTSESCNREQ